MSRNDIVIYYKIIRRKKLIDKRRHRLVHFYLRSNSYNTCSFDFRVKGNKKLTNPRRIFLRQSKKGVESNLYPYLVDFSRLGKIIVSKEELGVVINKVVSKTIKEELKLSN